MPGSTVGDFVPNRVPVFAKISALLDEAGEETGEIAASVASSVDTNIGDAARDFEYLRSDILGGASNLMDDAEKTQIRLGQHLYQQPINLLQDAYALRGALGYDVPTMDMVNYVNTTGDATPIILGERLPEKPGDGFEKPGYPTKPIGGTGIDNGDDTTTPPAIEPPTTDTKPPTEVIPPTIPPTEPPPVTPPTTPPTTQPPPTETPDTIPTDAEPGKPFGKPGDKIIGVEITDPNNPRCPNGYVLIGIEGNIAVCLSTEPPPEVIPPPPAEEPPPPIDEPNKPYEPPPEEIPPVSPPGTVIDPETCEYAKRPSVQIGCGSEPAPAQPPAPFWLVVGCDGCGWKWCMYQGDEPPEVKEGETLHGPFNTRPDPKVFILGTCKTVIKDDDDDGIDDDDEEDTGEAEDTDGEEEGEEDEEEGEEDEEEDKPGPKPEERPQPKPDEYCLFINGEAQGVGNVVPSFDVAIGFDKPDTLLGRLTQGAFRNQVQWLASFFPNTVNSVIGWARRTIEGALSTLACDRARMIPHTLAFAGFRVTQRWLGIIPHQTIDTMTQASNTICQSKIPGPKEVDAAYLRGDMTKTEWECYHKANGDYLSPAEKVMQSQRAKLDPSQIDWLFRRKYINQSQYDKLMREAGVIFDEDKSNIHNFNDQWPASSDIVRYMQRDVADEENIDWSEVDKEFKAKFRGRVKEYAEAAGIKPERMLDNWRAHFHIPSFTMGQRFFWRLRPGKQGVQKAFKREAFRKMLIQDDWHPAFIDYMIDTAYLPVTISDATRAYMIYAIKDDVLKSVFMDNGRDERAAEIMVDYWKRRREVEDRRRSGYPTLRRLAGQYARCEMTEMEYRDTIAKIVLSEEQEKAAIDAAILSRTVRLREQSIKAVRRPYILGILDDGEANQGLSEAGVDPSCINAMIDNWKLERLRRDKYLTADQLCGMRERGIIDAPTQLVALVRAGWNKDDAGLIVANCGAILSEKAARKADTMARRAAADAKRVQKEQERLRRLAECGPPPCPARRGGSSQTSAANPQSQGQTTVGTDANSPPNQ